MEKIIEKWEKIIDKNRGEDINYSRGVLEQMLNNFKQQVKLFAIPVVNKGEADLVCLKCAEKMRYDALLDLYYCPICSTQIKQTCC